MGGEDCGEHQVLGTYQMGPLDVKELPDTFGQESNMKTELLQGPAAIGTL